MKSFLILNKHKLFFIFTTIGAIFVFVFLSTILITTIVSDDYPDLKGFIVITLTAGLVIPFFLILISYFGWFYNRHLRMKLLRTRPFDQLDTMGFRIVLRNWKSRWAYTEETMQAKLNGYRVELDTNGNAPTTIAFKAFVQTMGSFDKLSDLKEKFKPEEFDFDFDGIIRKYDVKKSQHLTIVQLKSELTEFVAVLAKSGFMPAKND